MLLNGCCLTGSHIKASDPEPDARQQGIEKKRKKKKRERRNQSGLVDMVTRCAAAMAQIKSWQYKLLQNKKAEKRIFFFFPLSLSFSSNLSISLSPPTTSIGSASYTRCSERTAFFILRSCVLRNANLAAQSIPGPVVWGQNFLFTLNFSVCSQC